MEIGHWKVNEDIFLDSLYSPEEYQMFLSMVPNKNLWISTGLKEFLQKRCIHAKLNNNTFIFSKLNQFIKTYSENTFLFMYQLPFKELPLHINEKHALCKIVLNWRFILGK